VRYVFEPARSSLDWYLPSNPSSAEGEIFRSILLASSGCFFRSSQQQRFDDRPRCLQTSLGADLAAPLHYGSESCLFDDPGGARELPRSRSLLVISEIRCRHPFPDRVDGANFFAPLEIFSPFPPCPGSAVLFGPLEIVKSTQAIMPQSATL